jgi:hypothetical protein
MAGRKTNITFDIVPVAATLFFIVFMMRCTMDLAGGSSEIGNGMVLGRVVNEQGNPACSTIVRIMTSDYNPLKNGPLADTCIDTTNADGIYQLIAQHGRTYSIQAVHMTLRTRVIVPGVEMKNADCNVPQCTLKVPGAIKVLLPDSVDQLFGYVNVPGSDIFVFLNNGTGFVTLDSVPAGVIPAVYYSSTSISASAIIRYDVPVIPGDTTVVYNPSWKYARRLFLNMTTSGTNISGEVYNFPVLVRLTAVNFNFTQAKADGGDLRFTKDDGTPLPYEIERWDPVTELAEVWVKVDTVRGNDSLQRITMYWGNPAAISESSGAAVFDSSGGFEGVWHLNETSGALARDASHNGFTGTYRGGLPQGVPGPSDISQNIVRPDSDYIDMGNVLNPGMKNFSFGVWIKRAALGTQQAIIAKTNGNAPSAAYGYLLNFDDNNIPHLYMATGSGSWAGDSTFDVKTNLAITDSTTWHYVFVVIDRSDNALCKMYVDGIDRTGVKGGNVTHISAVSNALNFHIGTESDDNCSFSGAIGEVTVAFTARSADWVKLSYMNQKEQDALVKW